MNATHNEAILQSAEEHDTEAWLTAYNVFF